MLIAAVVVGALTAFYFGIKWGVYAAVASLALLAAAMVVPGLTIWAYAAIGLGIVGIVTVGPKRAKQNQTHAFQAYTWVRKGTSQAKKTLAKLWGSSDQPKR
jgi:hypothetical protein